MSRQTEELVMAVPTYYGTAHEVGRYRLNTEFDQPHVPLCIYDAAGLKIVLGSRDRDALSPDIQIERRPNGWAVFLHPLGGGDPCAVVYFHDDGRSWLVKERLGPTPELIEVDDVPAEIDR